MMSLSVSISSHSQPHAHIVIRFTKDVPVDCMHHVVQASLPAQSAQFEPSPSLPPLSRTVLTKEFNKREKLHPQRISKSYTFDSCFPKESSSRKSLFQSAHLDSSTSETDLADFWEKRRLNAVLSREFGKHVRTYVSEGMNWVNDGMAFDRRFASSFKSFLAGAQEKVDAYDRLCAELGLPNCKETFDIVRNWWAVHFKRAVIAKCGMIHSCKKGRCWKDGEDPICKYHYPFEPRDTTLVTLRGFVRHIRDGARSSMVVPHNFDLLLVAGCHVNVEFSHKVNVIQYIYKYIYKGSDNSYIKLTSEFYANKCKNDEINSYSLHRYVSASEAAWRILGFTINGDRYPSIGTLPVHIHGEDRVTFMSSMKRRKKRPAHERRKLLAQVHAREYGIDYADALESLNGFKNTDRRDRCSFNHLPDSSDSGSCSSGDEEPGRGPAVAMAGDPHRKCTALEQYLLRPRLVAINESADLLRGASDGFRKYLVRSGYAHATEAGAGAAAEAADAATAAEAAAGDGDSGDAGAGQYSIV